MRKYIYIFGAVILLVVIVVLLSAFRKPSVGGNNSLPSAVSSPEDANVKYLSQGEIAELAKPDNVVLGTLGGAVTVKNFYKNYIEIREDGILIAADANYEIGYTPGTGLFNVAILNASDSARKVAEDGFLNLLGIDQRSACLLKVEVTAYGAIKDFGIQNLSFCPR